MTDLTDNCSVLVTNDAGASILDTDGEGIDADGALSLFNDRLVRAVGLGTWAQPLFRPEQVR